MLLTEEEAKKKWCPYARRYSPGSSTTSYNRSQRDEPETGCIASECMAWQWHNKKLGHDREYMIREYGEAEGTKRWQAFNREQPLQGYCGLAGRP